MPGRVPRPVPESLVPRATATVPHHFQRLLQQLQRVLQRTGAPPHDSCQPRRVCVAAFRVASLRGHHQLVFCDWTGSFSKTKRNACPAVQQATLCTTLRPAFLLSQYYELQSIAAFALRILLLSHHNCYPSKFAGSCTLRPSTSLTTAW